MTLKGKRANASCFNIIILTFYICSWLYFKLLALKKKLLDALLMKLKTIKKIFVVNGENKVNGCLIFIYIVVVIVWIEIQFKLEALKNDTSYPLTVSSNQSLNRILNELKSQQKINEAALNMLRQRLTTTASDPMINNSTTSLRSSLGLLPPIYSGSSNEYLSGYLANIYDSTLSPEDIR